jgi:hypothetical protein
MQYIENRISSFTDSKENCWPHPSEGWKATPETVFDIFKKSLHQLDFILTQ